MRAEAHDEMRSAMNAAWAFVGGVAVVDGIAIAALGMRLPFGSLVMTVSGAAVLALLAVAYTRFRPDRIIAAIAESAAFLTVATASLALASYLGQGLAFPLRDSWFDRFDRAIGFDFHAHLAFLAAHPAIARSLETVYHTSALQLFGAIFILGFTGRIDRLRAFIVLFAATAFATIVVGSLVPALGNLAYYEIPDSLLPPLVDAKSGLAHVRHVVALREGSMRVLSFDDLRGLICFPSFHTALAIVTMWAVFEVRYIFPAAVCLNLPLIAATPSCGGHYVADVCGGVAMALAAILLLVFRPRILAAESATPQPAVQ